MRGGRALGSSHRHAEYPADNLAGPEDVARTAFHALGIDSLSAVNRGGRPFLLLEQGRVLAELF